MCDRTLSRSRIALRTRFFSERCSYSSQNFDRFYVLPRQKINNNTLLNRRMHLLFKRDVSHGQSALEIYSPPLYIPTQRVSRRHVIHFTEGALKRKVRLIFDLPPYIVNLSFKLYRYQRNYSRVNCYVCNLIAMLSYDVSGFKVNLNSLFYLMGWQESNFGLPQ